MCNGDERSLLDCPNQGWGQNSCGHERDAGVSCLQEGEREREAIHNLEHKTLFQSIRNLL